MANQVRIESLLGMLTIKLNDDNFIKWSYQFGSVLRGYDFFDHFTGDSVCPPKFVITSELGVTNEINAAYKEWVKIDMALLSLLLATLSDDAIEYVVGCKTSHEAWTALQDRYMSVSKASVNHLKAELHTMQKGGDTIDKYLLRLKTIKDQLQAAGEKVSDNDLIIAALTGLPSDYDMIRTVILAQDSTITLKEFRAQLIGAEKTIETRMQSLVQSMSAMYVNAQASNYPASSNSSGSASNVQFSPVVGSGYSGSSSSGPGYPGNQFQSSDYSGNNMSGRSFNGNNYRPRGNRGYRQKFNGSRSGNSWHQWLGNTFNRFEPIPECQICSRKGHVAVTCRLRNDNGINVHECQICGKRGHIALNCRHQSNYAYQGAQPSPSLSGNVAYQGVSMSPRGVDMGMVPPPSQFVNHNQFPQFLNVHQSPSFISPSVPSSSAGFPTMNAQASAATSNGDSWILDTGASHHMTPDLTVLDHSTPYECTEKIIVGNGEGLDDALQDSSYGFPFWKIVWFLVLQSIHTSDHIILLNCNPDPLSVFSWDILKGIKVLFVIICSLGKFLFLAMFIMMRLSYLFTLLGLMLLFCYCTLTTLSLQGLILK
ncbi:hypothetical protein D8674_004985 [Pyrus ussuriensis x Pyrus communis]|uniref:CCHC-type domain-containing protein n=1 Tax=Pyrus ussuriensis x Pyrus communis TaxID=2448454 RepID=A0A5N5FQ49_9ROSA|nr:hypothetical protein D8674_004985 [Pyrus ussuriensis x Pyrus communis]